MDLQNLTKKNQEFIHIATNQLIKDGKTDQEIKTILEDILPVLVDNQHKGLTARAIYGAPTAWATSLTEKQADKKGKNQEKNTNPWLMWIDTSLLFIGVVALLNGVMSFFSAATASTGVISLLALGLGGGAAMYATYHFIYRYMGKEKSQRPGWPKTILVLGLAMLAWILLYTLTALLPASINLKLPAIVMVIIGGVALLGRYILQKKYNVLNAMSPQQPTK